MYPAKEFRRFKLPLSAHSSCGTVPIQVPSSGDASGEAWKDVTYDLITGILQVKSLAKCYSDTDRYRLRQRQQHETSAVRSNLGRSAPRKALQAHACNSKIDTRRLFFYPARTAESLCIIASLSRMDKKLNGPYHFLPDETIYVNWTDDREATFTRWAFVLWRSSICYVETRFWSARQLKEE